MSRSDCDWKAIEQEIKAGTLPISEVARQYGVSQSAIYRRAKKEGWKRGEPTQSFAGRPSAYTQELADEICTRLAGGESLRSICRDEGKPHISTVLLWVVQDREGFSEQYMQAREAAGFAHADRVADLAAIAAEEGIDPQAARAAMDGLKWAAERMSPKRHSQRQEVDHRSGDGSMSPKPPTDLSDEQLAAIASQSSDES